MRHFIVMCDSNDGDYITDIVSISNEDVEKFMPLIEAIENYVPEIYGWGVSTNNWDDMREDLKDEIGTKNCFEKYSQFSKEYINDFFDKFLIGCCPEWACGPEMINSIHTIYKIQEITLKKEFVYADYEKLKKRSDNCKINQEYLERRKELYSYKNKLGISLGSIQFNEMTPKEIEIYNEYKNLWKKYR